MFSPLSPERSVRRHFDNAAPRYHHQTPVQQEIAKQLIDGLCGDVEPKAILEIGCGTGALTEQLLQKFTQAKITALDISQQMIEVARERLLSPKKITWMCAAAEQLTAGDAKFDLVVSASTLQWVGKLEDFFLGLRELLKPDGVLAFSIMLQGTLQELHEVRHQVAPAKNPAAKLHSFEEVSKSLERSGYLLSTSYLRRYHESHTDGAALLKNLKARGFTGGNLSQGKQLLTRGEIFRLAALYDERYRSEKGDVRASFVSGFFEARLA